MRSNELYQIIKSESYEWRNAILKAAGYQWRKITMEEWDTRYSCPGQGLFIVENEQPIHYRFVDGGEHWVLFPPEDVDEAPVMAIGRNTGCISSIVHTVLTREYRAIARLA
jgi:hypothetical protein